MAKNLLAAGLAFVAPMVALAGTCSSPTPLSSFSSTLGTTCGGEVGINMGGTVYGHPSKVYSFRVNHQGPDGEPLSPISLTGDTREAALTASCTDAPLAVAAAGVLAIDLQNIPNGNYLLVVSTDPSIPTQPAPGVCGDFTVTARTLPVSLKSFSVE